MSEATWRTGLVCGVAVLLVTACFPGVASPGACGYGGWTQPREVTPDEGALREPAVASNPSGTVLVGSGFLGSRGAWSDDPVPKARLVVRGLEGSTWPDLEDLDDRLTLLRPRAVSRPVGDLHVVWGEPDSLPATNGERSMASPVALWHARLGADGAWSDPEPIAGPYTHITWASGSAEVELDRKGRLHVLASVMSPEAGALHLVETGGRWRSGAEFPDFAYLSALFDLEAPMAAMVAASARFGRNALFLAHRRDGAWTREDTAVAVSDEGVTIHDVKLLRSGDGVVHLLWATREAMGGYSAVFHRYRRDGRWSETARLELESPAPFLGPVVDRCGRLHLIYTAWDTVKELSDRPVLPVFRYRRWQEGWSGELPPPPTLFAAMPAVGRSRDGSPLVVSTAVVDSSAADPARTTTVWSRLPVLPEGGAP